MSNNPIESIVTPYKETTSYGKVIKVLSANRYLVRLDSGVSVNVTSEQPQTLNSYVMIKNGGIEGKYKQPSGTKTVEV